MREFTVAETIRRSGLAVMATLGPASATRQALRALLASGATAFRINLAHARAEWLDGVLEAISQVEAETGWPHLGVADLPGRKPRTGALPVPVPVAPGDRIWLGQGLPPQPGNLVLPLRGELADLDVPPGQVIQLRDGRLRLELRQQVTGGFLCEALTAGEATSRMGVVFACGIRVERPFPTESFERCLAGGIRRFLQSYCDRPEDLGPALAAARRLDVTDAEVIPKLETREALRNAPGILSRAPLACLARGDLGTQIPLERVPGVELRLLELAAGCGARVLVAGDVMPATLPAGEASRPERAAAYYALAHGAAGFILSDETALGNQAASAVRQLSRVIETWLEDKEAGPRSPLLATEVESGAD